MRDTLLNVRHHTHAMKTFVTILIFVAVHFLKSTSLAADAVRVSPSPIELVMNCGNKFENDGFYASVVFGDAHRSPTNMAIEVTFRNVGEKSVWPHTPIDSLSIVWDGKEYKQTLHSSPRSETPIESQSTGRHYYFLSDFNITPEALATGRHTVAVRTTFQEKSTFTVSEPTEGPTKLVFSQSDRQIFAESSTLTVFINTP